MVICFLEGANSPFFVTEDNKENKDPVFVANGEWVRETLAGCWQGATKEHSRGFCD
jgi:hypothetical protein